MTPAPTKSQRAFSQKSFFDRSSWENVVLMRSLNRVEAAPLARGDEESGQADDDENESEFAHFGSPLQYFRIDGSIASAQWLMPPIRFFAFA